MEMGLICVEFGGKRVIMDLRAVVKVEIRLEEIVII